MRITSKGQVTIPQHIREAAGLHPNMEVEFEFKDGLVYLKPADGLTRGQRLVAKLRGSMKGSGLTTDEIMDITRGED